MNTYFLGFQNEELQLVAYIQFDFGMGNNILGIHDLDNNLLCQRFQYPLDFLLRMRSKQSKNIKFKSLIFILKISRLKLRKKYIHLIC
jgi:hypothetical protein